MNKYVKLPQAALAAALLSLLWVGLLQAQTFTILHSFAPFQATDPAINPTNSDGAHPLASLLLVGNVLYGTAQGGGDSGVGTIFKINGDGTGFTVLRSFSALSSGYYGTNCDGGSPQAGLVLFGQALYGAAVAGGNSEGGTLFKITTAGTGFTNLHDFVWSSDGNCPWGTLILSGDTLFGTAFNYGSPEGDGLTGSRGTVFRSSTDGSCFAVIHRFPAPTTNSMGVWTNNDGGSLASGLFLSGTTLFGTASACGNEGSGTVFAINVDGTGFTVLHSFSAVATNSVGAYTNSDGAWPQVALVLWDNTLYGTTVQGGEWGSGTIFKVMTDGTGFAVLRSFTALSQGRYGTNQDGAFPYAGLIASNNLLYGTAASGGSGGCGTVFSLKTNGAGFRVLHDFPATGGGWPGTNSDGAGPMAGLILSGDALYGTAAGGGSGGNGTLFSISMAVSAPELTLAHAGSNVVLTWPTNAAQLALQSAGSLDLSAPWTPVSCTPVISNGLYQVTLFISATQQFYRLSTLAP